jgi:hypothetical protein
MVNADKLIQDDGVLSSQLEFPLNLVDYKK